MPYTHKEWLDAAIGGLNLTTGRKFEDEKYADDYPFSVEDVLCWFEQKHFALQGFSQLKNVFMLFFKGWYLETVREWEERWNRIFFPKDIMDQHYSTMEWLVQMYYQGYAFKKITDDEEGEALREDIGKIAEAIGDIALEVVKAIATEDELEHDPELNDLDCEALTSQAPSYYDLTTTAYLLWALEHSRPEQKVKRIVAVWMGISASKNFAESTDWA